MILRFCGFECSGYATAVGAQGEEKGWTQLVAKEKVPKEKVAKEKVPIWLHLNPAIWEAIAGTGWRTVQSAAVILLGRCR
jgi:hypothetical protein